MRPAARAPYSYQAIPDLPPFGQALDQDRVLLVMDGDCALCSGAARRIAALDRRNRIRITPAQSALGRALLAHYDLAPDDPTSWLMIRNGQAWGSLDAMIRLGALLHPLLWVLNVARILPVPLQDWLYARLARNRYRLFGRDDLCAMPSPALKRRLVE